MGYPIAPEIIMKPTGSSGTDHYSCTTDVIGLTLEVLTSLSS
ncbi:unnamed protein product [Penicillium camemberti]|uniref:Str. FM013 n=1 Tax=Penicillium camemberti (strain FM 013) TaxID=1429867 RepID=A0A0G4PE58_PENC3|nr:unnamed protein product [Penicillium camemberti]